MTDYCRVCDAPLVVGENWNPYHVKIHTRICKTCYNAYQRRRYVVSPVIRKRVGHHPLGESKTCAQYLGVYVAERVLSHVFKDVKRMPYGHPGYDFICNRGKRIDVKSACQQKQAHSWAFRIRYNTIADYFLCLAFDDREALNPMHIWLIPGKTVNNKYTIGISPSTVSKWDEYALDIENVVTCCNIIKGDE